MESTKNPVNQLRGAQLYIAEEIKRICEKHGIRYFLDCGSMLGAVRHHGFIPWDDDMDIGMIQEEFERFVQVAPEELGKEFYLDYYPINKQCSVLYAKIRLLGTTFIEHTSNVNNPHNEIFVDIFPYIGCSGNRLIRSLDGFFISMIGYAIALKCGIAIWGEKNGREAIKFIPSVLLSKMMSLERLRKKSFQYTNKYKQSDTVCILDGQRKCYINEALPRSTYDEYIDVLFEGRHFKTLKEFDKRLRANYGNDYMTLPPEEKRKPHHHVKVDLGHYMF